MLNTHSSTRGRNNKSQILSWEKSGKKNKRTPHGKINMLRRTFVTKEERVIKSELL